MKNKSMKVCWISAGISSFLAGYYEKDTVDKFIYIDISDQHPDSIRFIKDCEKLLEKQIEILKSNEYKSVEQAIRAAGVITLPGGFAPCTNWLKKECVNNGNMNTVNMTLLMFGEWIVMKSTVPRDWKKQ